MRDSYRQLKNELLDQSTYTLKEVEHRLDMVMLHAAEVEHIITCCYCDAQYIAKQAGGCPYCRIEKQSSHHFYMMDRLLNDVEELIGRLKQIDTERIHWKRWTEEAEADRYHYRTALERIIFLSKDMPDDALEVEIAKAALNEVAQ